MRRSVAVVAALFTFLSLSGARAAGPSNPVVPQKRNTEPVVLTGAQFPTWSAGPEPAVHEPQVPTNYDTADVQGSLPDAIRSACYHAPSDNPTASHPNPYDYSDNGDHNCYQPNRVPYTAKSGANVNNILGYVWDAGTGSFRQIPFQVDEVFTRFITNNVSGFAFYSGVDKETTYAFDREGFRYTWDDYLLHGGNPCTPRPAPGSYIDKRTGYATTPDPIRGLDDNDELAFMYDDARAAAPAGAKLPDGILSSYDIAVADPTNPGVPLHVYVMLSRGGATDPHRQFFASNGYVRYQRDPGVTDPNNPGKYLTPPADMFAYSQSSYDGYGAAPKGAYCELDGTISTTYRKGDRIARGQTTGSAAGYTPPDPKPWAIEQRRPLDTAWVKTPRYWFRYDGRWLMTQLRISNDNTGLKAKPHLGPDIIDQWKARAFQQRPGGDTPCCGYEEEVNNWGGSSILFGERWGPVRAIRAAWGADSSTNNIKTEIFYRDEIRFDDALRVHVIPPADGIYVQWDYNAGKVSTYYNPWQPNGAPIDGRNDEVFGNTFVQYGDDGLEVRDDDPIPVVGPQDIRVPPGGGTTCNGLCNDLDFADPTFSGPSGDLNWEEVAGPNGSLVTRWTIKQHTGGDSYSLIAQPYYRDDSCFDDGTGTNPGPHLHGRGVDNGAYGTYLDPATGTQKARVCWTPADGDPNDTSIGDGRPNKFWQGDIATHGLHLQLIVDSDNAQLAEPVDEIVSEQRMVVLPGLQPNVGDVYGRGTDYPLVSVVTPYTI